MYDATGKLCREDKFIKKGKWGTDGLSPGLYYVRIKGERILFIEKLLILGQ